MNDNARSLVEACLREFGRHSEGLTVRLTLAEIGRRRLTRFELIEAHRLLSHARRAGKCMKQLKKN